MKWMSSGTLGATLSSSITRAQAITAHTHNHSIKDVDHIVVLTQENRSFDHYFGTLNGVRGFSDPRAVRLPSGKAVWYQADGATEVMPFHPDVINPGMAFFPDPPHGWNDSHAAWNDGRYDKWVPAKGASAMSYLTRKDIPFHFALADAFTICDAYYCSLLGPTDPNRYHLWTGWTGNDGAGGGPVITNAEVGYDWMTFPERLQQANISWKVYQDAGVGLDANGFWGWTDDAFIGNYGDNSLLYFHQYQNALAGTPLADKARTGTNIAKQGSLFDQLRADVMGGRLPQVSYIAAPEAYSEHPNWPANYGAWYIAQIIDALTANPEVWSRTALFINYDENGGFFDHMVPPSPAHGAGEGLSTLSTANEYFAGDGAHVPGPYGLGVRVPMLVVSPWSRGGYVNSQVFDHTSVIRFIETRFAEEHPELVETNITPWRRAVVGDLTTAFDFVQPNAAFPRLPSTAAYLPTSKLRHPDDIIVAGAGAVLPRQERGVRRARALPYRLEARGMLAPMAQGFAIEFSNHGEATAVFQVRAAHADIAPRSYTVEAGKHLKDQWLLGAGGDYDLSVFGPNGFLRAFKGRMHGEQDALLEAHADCRHQGEKVLSLRVANFGKLPAKVHVHDNYTSETFAGGLSPDDVMDRHHACARHFGWYDLVITCSEDASFRWQFAGHIEDGRDSISDPTLGRGVTSI
jgi:phospholipase C